MTKFDVTYEIITEASAENGEAEESGFVVQDVCLRDAIGHVRETESPHCGEAGMEASDSCVGEAQWLTVYNTMDYISGKYENRSLHFPDNLTPSSRRRIARLLGISA